MIFVTVGTHEQQFNRLVKYMDEWAENHDEEVVIQTGFSTYKPKYATWKPLFSYNEMKENIDKARIVITHGGPSSFIAPLQIGKIPIVVPRSKEYAEHVNNHQVTFCREVAERYGSIIKIEDINTLASIIDDYDDVISNMSASNGIYTNNEKFNKEFKVLVEELFN